MKLRDVTVDGWLYEEIEIGDSASIEKTLSESDVYNFAGIIGDFNVAHVNAEHSKGNRFGKRIAHGALVSALISTVIGMKLPGEGCLYVSQNSKFVKPTFFGDTLKATCTVIEKDPVKKRIKMETRVVKADGTTVLVGEAVVLPKSKE